MKESSLKIRDGLTSNLMVFISLGVSVCIAFMCYSHTHMRVCTNALKDKRGEQNRTGTGHALDIWHKVSAVFPCRWSFWSCGELNPALAA